MNRSVVIIILFAAVAMLFVVFLSTKPIDDTFVARQYLKEQGWETKDVPEECEDVVIDTHSDVMAEYLKLQRENGFELSQYDGKTVKRFTFKIKNYMSDSDVFANVLVYKGKVIGGDIMTRELDGFMKGLIKNGTS